MPQATKEQLEEMTQCIKDCKTFPPHLRKFNSADRVFRLTQKINDAAADDDDDDDDDDNAADNATKEKEDDNDDDGDSNDDTRDTSEEESVGESKSKYLALDGYRNSNSGATVFNITGTEGEVFNTTKDKAEHKRRRKSRTCLPEDNMQIHPDDEFCDGKFDGKFLTGIKVRIPCVCVCVCMSLSLTRC